MNNKEFINLNKEGWNKLRKNNKPFSNTSLPEYGPYIKNEEKLQLFKEIKGKKILELGCGSGKSLEYLANKGASELWGIDISEEQINNAKKLNIHNSHFIISPMEEDTNIPKNYFDYVLTLYSIGYSSDPIKTIKLSSSYLKQNGKFILSWTHPLFNCLDIQNNKIVINHNYNDEEPQIIIKGSDKIKLLEYNLKISTLINTLILSGLEIDKIIEESPTKTNGIGDYKSPYFDERKLTVAPTTLIIIAHKK